MNRIFTMTLLFAAPFAFAAELDLQPGEISINARLTDLHLYRDTRTYEDESGPQILTETTTGVGAGLTARYAVSDVLTVGSFLRYDSWSVHTENVQGTTVLSDSEERAVSIAPMVEYKLAKDLYVTANYLFISSTLGQTYFPELSDLADNVTGGDFTIQELALGGLYKTQASDAFLVEVRGSAALASMREQNPNNENNYTKWSFLNFYGSLTGRYFVSPRLSVDGLISMQSLSSISRMEDGAKIDLTDISNKASNLGFTAGFSYYFR